VAQLYPWAPILVAWEHNINIGFRIRREGMNCIHMPQDRDQWHALVNAEMNLGVP
jgi:hypothetical protein